MTGNWFTYFTRVVSYRLLAALISIPVGYFAARGLQLFFAGFSNIENAEPQIDPTAVAIQVIICLLAPLLAAMILLWAGARINVRKAISTYGLTGAVDQAGRAVANIRAVPYMLLQIVANTFRRRRRVLVVEIALDAAGAIFMAVLGVMDAANYTYGDKLAAVHNFDVTLSFKEPVRAGRLNTALPHNRISTMPKAGLLIPLKADRPARLRSQWRILA